MTGVAVDGGVVFRLAVAIYTPAHRHRRDDFDNIHAIHLTMTLNTVNAGRDMWLMAEQNVVRKVMDFNPFNRCSISPGLGELLNLRLARGNLRMAVHTRIDAGNGGHRTFAGRYVTVTAGDFVLASMNLVAKCDGLFGSVTFARVRASGRSYRSGENNDSENKKVTWAHTTNDSRIH